MLDFQHKYYRGVGLTFSTKLEIDHDDCDLGTCNYENDKNKEQKSKEIIKFIFPNGRENEK